MSNMIPDNPADPTIADQGAATPVPPPVVPDDDPYDKPRAMELIAKLRQEVKDAKAASHEAAALKAKLDELETASLSEQERIVKERDDLLAEKAKWAQDQQDTNLRLAVYSKQTELGIADADIALALLDKNAIVWENGQPTNITDTLTALLEAKPLLKGVTAPPVPQAPNLNAGGGNAPGRAPSLTADELEFATKMGLTPAEYDAYKATSQNGMLTLDQARAAETAATTTP